MAKRTRKLREPSGLCRWRHHSLCTLNSVSFLNAELIQHVVDLDFAIGREEDDSNGHRTCQYTKPESPFGSKTAVCRMVEPRRSPMTSNSSHARPGSFIFAWSLSRRLGS